MDGMGSMTKLDWLLRVGKKFLFLVFIALLLAALPYGWRPAAVDDRHGQNAQAPIGLMAGRIDGTYLQMANDIAELVEPQDIRVIPMVGRGSVQAVDDLLWHECVDLAMLQIDVLNLANANAPELDLEASLRYVTSLYDEEMHVLARRDIASIWELHGKAVNVGPSSSGTFLTSQFVFNDLGIDVDTRTMSNREALLALERGEIAAMTQIVGQPALIYQTISPKDLHFLPIPADLVGVPYGTAELTNESYPQLIDQPIETVTVLAVLATFIDPERPDQQARVDRFVKAFLSNFSRLGESDHHPKWREVNPSIDIPGWRRLPSAEQTLAGSLHAGAIAHGR